MKEHYWVSTSFATAQVTIENGAIIDTAPVWRKFIGTNFNKFLEWLEQKNGEVKWIRIG